MQNLFKPGERGRVCENPMPEQPSVDTALCGFDFWKCVRNAPNPAATGREEPMDHVIGIEQGDAQAVQHRRSGALPHADGSGKAENNQRGLTRLATIAARKSGVTRTGAPNQASKPGRP